jgi:hypothetical protein
MAAFERDVEKVVCAAFEDEEIGDMMVEAYKDLTTFGAISAVVTFYIASALAY